MDVSILLFSILLSGAGAIQVVLVSMDGFRWDYLNRVPTPNFDRLARHGTKIEHIDNTFVTETFPCHYSISTGEDVLKRKPNLNKRLDMLPIILNSFSVR